MVIRLIVIVALFVPALPAVGQFTAGDLYLFTHDDPDWSTAVVRIDPVTGAKSLLHQLAGPQTQIQIAWEPCRDRLVIREAASAFTLIDASGNATTLPYSWPGHIVDLIAPDGTGRIYVTDAGPGRWAYLDGTGAMQTLLDDQGDPLVFNHLHTIRNDLIYDGVTHSLFLTEFGAATIIHKLPLNADGTALAGPVQTVTYDAFPGEGDDPYGLSAGPNGTLFIKIDTNTNADGVRMFTCDPVTLACQDFASIGHTFVAGNTAGTYDSVHGYAAALDTGNDVIRTFLQAGGVQEGTILATGVSGPGGSHELAELISIGDTINGPIGPGVCCPADADGSGVVDIGDLLGLLAAWGTANGAYDLAPAGGDGVVDIQDLLALLSAWGPC